VIARHGFDGRRRCILLLGLRHQEERKERGLRSSRSLAGEGDCTDCEGAEGGGTVGSTRECVECQHLSSPVFALTSLLPVQYFVGLTSTGQRFRDVCALAIKRFRRVRELFHDGFATPGGQIPTKRFCNSFMMSHA